MKKSLLVGTAIAAGLLIAISPVLAQGGQSFRGMAQSMNGSVLTVTGGDETHRFQISGSTKITGPGGKRETIKDCLNQSVEVTYSGNKEPYQATSIAALED